MKSLGGLILAAVFGLAAQAMAEEVATAVCVNGGNKYKAGEYACVAACHGQRRLARCDVTAEHASWTYVSNACPSALLPDSPTDTNLAPVAVAMTPIPFPIERMASEMSSEAWMHFIDLRKQVAALH